MPFLTDDDVELNIIWLGNNKLPKEQLDNLFVLIKANPKFKINIWVDTKNTYATLISQLKDAKFSFKGANLAFIEINEDSLNIPDSIKGVTSKARERKIWAGISDVLRLFVLSRKWDPTKSRPARFYIELDNVIKKEFWNRFKSKKFAAVCSSYDNKGEALFSPMHIRGDMLFLDMLSEVATNFSAKMSKNLEMILSDPIIKLCFEELLASDEWHGADIMGTFGMLVNALIRIYFMSESPQNGYGLADYLLQENDFKKEYLPGCINIQARRTHSSWRNPEEKPRIDFLGIIATSRLYQISDPTTKKMADIFMKDLTKVDGMTLTSFCLGLIRELSKDGEVVPTWLLNTCELLTDEDNKVSVRQCARSKLKA